VVRPTGSGRSEPFADGAVLLPSTPITNLPSAFGFFASRVHEYFAADYFQLLFGVMIKVDPQLGAFSVSDLRQRPEFFDTISRRVWHAWWKQRGFPLKYIAGRLREHLDANPVPFALVAHDGPTFKGSTLVIESDMDDRPQYSPWVAAVWVDAEYRKRGVGAALIDNAAQSAFAVGIGRVYLCATRLNRDFYLKRGWTKIEEDVGEDLLTVMVRCCGPEHKSPDPITSADTGPQSLRISGRSRPD
jgi:N-acetylglutamate synthase-like GNAT family acetyltransferase